MRPLTSQLNPEGINTGNPLEVTVCPFSLERLKEMYLFQMNSTLEIATLSTSIGYPATDTTVQSWLRKIGISRRSKSLSGKLFHAKNPEHHKDSLSKAVEASKASQRVKELSIEKAKKNRVKAIAARVRKQIRSRIWFTCELPECAKRYAVPVCKSNIHPHHYCSRRCAAICNARKRAMGNNPDNIPQWNAEQLALLAEIEAIRNATSRNA